MGDPCLSPNRPRLLLQLSLLYDTGIQLYGTALKLAAPFHPKAAKWVNGRKNWWTKNQGGLQQLKGGIWMHCASLGEFEQGRPVIEALRHAHPNLPVIVSFFSPSGFEIRKNYKGADAVIYLPLDSRRNARMLTALIEPKLVLWVKYEFWINILNELYRKGTPVILFSGIFRPGQRFFKPWGGAFRRVIRQFSAVFIQDQKSQILLEKIGVSAQVVGDTRFDRVYDIAQNGRRIEPVQRFSEGKKCIVAGSTWPMDEKLLTRYIQQRGDVHLVIAPHEVNETHLEEIEERFSPLSIRLSDLPADGNTDKRVLIIDQIGLLNRIYPSGQVAYIGGGFGAGIHNTLEAAVYGIPVLFGPNYQKFNEAVDILKSGGGFTVSAYADLENTLDAFWGDEGRRRSAGQAAAAYVEASIGATHKIVKCASALLDQD